MCNTHEMLIQLFMHNQLQQTNIYCKINDSILEELQQKTAMNKQSILKKLIFDSSYNSPRLCTELICLYSKEYDCSQDYFCIWQVFKNLYKYYKEYTYDLYIAYMKWLSPISVLYTRYNTIINKIKLNQIKYSTIRINDKDNNLKYNLKMLFIFIHKMYKNIYRERYLPIDELILGLNNFYLSDFSFSNKDNKLFFNIFVDVFICNYQLIHEEFNKTNDFWIIENREWFKFLDKIFSNWHLLYSRHKKFFRIETNKIINMLNTADLMQSNFICNTVEKNIFLQLINKL